MDTTHSPAEEKDSIPFYPDHVRTEFYVTLGVLGLFLIIGILGLLRPVGLQAPADPLNTPAHVKPEWYFLALYQILKFVPKTVGVLIPLVGVAIVLLWPFLDRTQDTRRAQRVRLIVTVIGLITVIVLTIWGEVS